MSGLEALSIACNIMQVFSFAHETISFCRAVYQGDSITEYDDHNVQSLLSLSDQLQNNYQGFKPQTSDEKKLEEIAKKCNIAARALKEEMGFIRSQKARGNLAQTLTITVKIQWRRCRLEILGRSLRTHQRTMESYLLARVCKQSDAIELRQRQGYEKLSQDIKFFVEKYATGCTKTTDLIKLELVSTREATIEQVLRSEESIKTHLSNEISTAETAVTVHVTKERKEVVKTIAQTAFERDASHTTEMQRNQFLQSLRFLDINARKNDLVDAYEGTYKWIFCGSEVLENQGSGSGASTFSTAASNNQSDDEFNIIDSQWDNFSDWLKSDSNIYWISGKPGSGKSTLTALTHF
ncbi:hypothetical protein F4805DRAFT_285719 [Annulohypoxylon moriforme]|nr:hypothetical protein F4805DRAFT_285719 [Annulohypoxylon moriforme]